MSDSDPEPGGRLSEDVLAAIRPDTMASGSPKWQQRKSAETRIRILEATIDCLVEKGYSRLSINEVSSRAGASRGAMHHHFPGRMSLVTAVIDYTFYQRARHFLEAYATADSADWIDAACEFHWQSVQTREYRAYLELAVAARTDAELNGAFEPALRRFDDVWTREVWKAFPQWHDKLASLQLASDLAATAHMGLLLQQPALAKPERSAAVRGLIADVVKRLFRGDIEKPDSPPDF